MVLDTANGADETAMPSFGVHPRAIDDRPHAYEVTVSGEIDIDAAAAIDRELDALVDAGATFIVLDLSAVTFLDSSGIRSVVRAARVVGDHGGRLTCSGLSGAATRVLEISGLLEHLRDGPDHRPPT
jgi:anti-sigma B factor antagonist